MDKQTATPTTGAETADPTLTILAEQADSILFDTLDVDDFEELVFYTDDQTGKLLVTADQSDAFVRLETDETGLGAVEAEEVEEEDLTEIEITDPQPTTDVEGGRTRLRGD